jgi:NADH-quinone oxidoreductase subunit M
VANWPLLSILIWLPILGGAVVLLFGKQRAEASRWAALVVSLLTLAFSIPLLTGLDHGDGGMHFKEAHAWISTWNINYALGADGISVALIVLTTITTVLALVGAWRSVDKRVNQYMASFLFLEGMMIGVFAATDAILFYVFFEVMLVPMFLIIGIWGGPRRIYAAIKFFLYTFLGSVLMLVGLIYLYMKSGSFALGDLYQLKLSATEQTWLFFAFFIAFAVKVPMFPVHTWLPDAHVEAPTAGSVILAAVMLKIGGYGFIRFSLPIVPDAGAEWAWLVIALSLVAVIYVGLVALVQDDMKKLIAYSSIAHMGFVTLGIFVVFALVRNGSFPISIVAGGMTSPPQQGIGTDAAILGLQGAMVQMISHGFVSGAMFSCVGILYDRMHTRRIGDYGGVVNVMPWFATFAMLFYMANAGLPGTSGFVGEFMVILASFQEHPLVALGAATTLVIGAAYTLWLYKRIFFGEVANPQVAALKDINGREMFVLLVFAAGVLLIGLWPKPLTDLMEPSIVELAGLLTQSKL